MASTLPRGHHFGLSLSGPGDPVRTPPDLHDDVFAISPDIRHVALGSGQNVMARSRADAPEGGERYEELLVNPTLITLAGQWGDLDRGGLRYLVVSYGHFDQLVIPLATGHLSIAFKSDRDPARHLPALAQILTHHGHPPRNTPDR
ncbi:hypothetical protein [Spirillospora sp. NPDC047279]|uniref:hypothetical protein n=1 Tax=Spirillospora sp. NPDC047279 TaxID=3155478 RepID=UPI0034080633